MQLLELKVNYFETRCCFLLPGVYVLTNNSFTGEEEVLAGLCKQIQSDSCSAVAYATLKMKAETESQKSFQM